MDGADAADDAMATDAALTAPGAPADGAAAPEAKEEENEDVADAASKPKKNDLTLRSRLRGPNDDELARQCPLDDKGYVDDDDNPEGPDRWVNVKKKKKQPKAKAPTAKPPTAQKPKPKPKPRAKKAPKPAPTHASSSDESEDQDDGLRPVQLRDGATAKADVPENLETETSRARANPVFAADPSKDSDELLVIQFPTSLPAALPRRRPRSDSNEGRAFDAVQRLKPGKIGTLQLLASGDVRLKMGGETFDVDRGLFQSQAQQICAVDASEGQLCVLGDVETKLVCTTRVEEDDGPVDWSKMLAKAEAEYEAQHAARMRDD